MTLGLSRKGMFEPFRMIVVDHPYLCIIRECLTGAVIFVAAILNPASQ